jgi:hypothetical protein
MSGVISALNKDLFIVVPGDTTLIQFITDENNPSWTNGSGQTGFSFTYRSVICNDSAPLPSYQFRSSDACLPLGVQVLLVNMLVPIVVYVKVTAILEPPNNPSCDLTAAYSILSVIHQPNRMSN